MLEFSLYVNMMLFAVGILLIFVVLAKQQEHPILVRAILLAYFVVVLQYNFDRFYLIDQKILLASALVALTAWVRQPIPAAETE